MVYLINLMKSKQRIEQIKNTTTVYEKQLREALDKLEIEYHINSCLYGYYPDLIIAGLRFIIEVDGEYHSKPYQIAKDKKRDKILKSKGYHILRITNNQVETKIDKVCSKIIDTMKKLSKTHRIDFKHNLSIIPI